MMGVPSQNTLGHTVTVMTPLSPGSKWLRVPMGGEECSISYACMVKEECHAIDQSNVRVAIWAANVPSRAAAWVKRTMIPNHCSELCIARRVT